VLTLGVLDLVLAIVAAFPLRLRVVVLQRVQASRGNLLFRLGWVEARQRETKCCIA
jgi:hypothetical protein